VFYASDASHHIQTSKYLSVIYVMPRTLERCYLPCHVAGCRFLTTSNARLKNHLRTHPPELRARRRCREHAHHEIEMHQNADNAFFSNLHESGSGSNSDDCDDDAEERQNPSMPQCDADRNAPKYIQPYHPIINGTCILCVSLCRS